jgi:hypothetical protein
MAGISVTISGDNIQLSFRKGDQSTAVVMDGPTAQSLHEALGKLLITIRADEIGEEEIFDVTSLPSMSGSTRRASRSWRSRPVPCPRSFCG